MSKLTPDEEFERVKEEIKANMDLARERMIKAADWYEAARNAAQAARELAWSDDRLGEQNEELYDYLHALAVLVENVMENAGWSSSSLMC